MSWLGVGEIESAIALPRGPRQELLIYQRPIKGYRDGTFPVRVNDAPNYGPPHPQVVGNWSPWTDSRVAKEKF